MKLFGFLIYPPRLGGQFALVFLASWRLGGSIIVQFFSSTLCASVVNIALLGGLGVLAVQLFDSYSHVPRELRLLHELCLDIAREFFRGRARRQLDSPFEVALVQFRRPDRPGDLGVQPHEHVPRRSCRGNEDRKSTRLNSSHGYISYAVFCLKKKNINLLRRVQR